MLEVIITLLLKVYKILTNFFANNLFEVDSLKKKKIEVIIIIYFIIS